MTLFDCLDNFENLGILNLINNNYSCVILNSIGYEHSYNIEFAHCWKITLSLSNCSSLVFLDMISNKLQREIGYKKA